MESISSNSFRKRRQSKACTRCRKRKIRCDCRYPSCGACTRADATCLGFDSIHRTDKPRSTVSHLENEAARLEIELGRVKSQTTSLSDTANAAVERLTTTLATAMIEPSGRSRKQESLLPLTSSFFLSGSPAPYLSDLAWDDPEPEQTPGEETQLIAIAVSSIPRNIIDVMFKNYCEMYRPRYPAVEESDLYGAYDRVYNNTEPSAFDCFCTYITLAISTNTLVAHDEKRARIASSGLWATAMVYLGQIGLAASWERLEALQLLAHYAFLNPRDVDCSKCAASATRLCLQLGLHLELPTGAQMKLDTVSLNTRRRLFWNSYSIDSAVHSVRCRPFLWPACAFTAKFPTSDSKSSPGIHVFLLRQIESEITLALYYPTLDNDPLSNASFGLWHTRMHERLDEWYQATRQSVNLTEKIEFYELFFHAQMLRLNRSSPRCPSPSKEMRRKALKSSISLIKEFSIIDRLESGICLLASVLTGMTKGSGYCTHLEGEDVTILKRYMKTFSFLVAQVSRRWTNITRHASAIEAVTSSVLDKVGQWSSGETVESSDLQDLKQKLNQFSLFTPLPPDPRPSSEDRILQDANDDPNAGHISRLDNVLLHSAENRVSRILEAQQYPQPGATTSSATEPYSTFDSSHQQVPTIADEPFNSAWNPSRPAPECSTETFPELYDIALDDGLQWYFSGMDSEELFGALLDGGGLPPSSDFGMG